MNNLKKVTTTDTVNYPSLKKTSSKKVVPIAEFLAVKPHHERIQTAEGRKRAQKKARIEAQKIKSAEK